MDSHQRWSPSDVSIIYVCAIEVGVSTPYLCDIIFIPIFTADIILSRLRRVNGIHQANAGSSDIHVVAVNSASSIGLHSLSILSGIYCLLPSL